MKQGAFEATSNYRASHTSLLSFVTPAAAALWNMRWQVRGFLDEVPEATEEDLFGRFAAGSGLRAGNLRQVFGKDSWDEQLSRFGEVLLLTSFALYEGWVHELLTAVTLPPGDGPALRKVLSSATVSAAAQAQGLATLSTNPSALAATQFQPTLRGAAHSQPVRSLPELLTAMRAFKAIRNAFIHSSGRLDQFAVNAIRTASGLRAVDLGMKAAPTYPSPAVGRVAEVSYRGAVSCSALLLKIVTTVDAELSGSASCEADVLRRVRNHPKIGAWKFMPGNSNARASRVARLLADVGAPSPVDIHAIAKWLKSEGVIWY